MCFDSKEKANIEAQKHPNNSLGWCPIIKDSCNVMCVCFNETNIQEQKIGIGENAEFRYHVYPAYCSHVLISGEIGTYQ